MEQQLRAAERERAAAVAERILQRAPASRAAFAAVAQAQRAVVAADGSVVVDDVGWLEPAPSPIDRDFVVEDRLDRATAAEFRDRDAAAAQRAFDELLAAPLVPAVRLQVVAAAAWQAARAQASERSATLRAELDELLQSVLPADLARPQLAAAVAAALRLCGAGPWPAWADALAPFLPPNALAGLEHGQRWAAAAQRHIDRRELLLRTRAAWLARTSREVAGLAAADALQLLWWLPREAGGHDVALLSPTELCSALAQAGREGALPDLPLPFHFDLAPDTATAFADVPGLRGLVDERDALAEPAWLRPTLTGALLLVLLLAFGLAVVLQARAAQREVAAARMQTEFLTTVTHELKTPLAGIRLLGEMLADGRAHGREADYHRMLTGEAARLSLLIENVLDLGRLERGARAYDLRPTDLGDAIAETLAWFAPLAEHDGLRVQWDDQLGSARPQLDRAAFVQALVAVLYNARKYGLAGGRIDVVTRSEGNGMALDVRDHGAGVPDGERDRIFDRFVRGSAHAHGSTPGVGIGLHLARTIARRLHGELVCGEPLDGGPGARFTFTFPLENAP